MNEPYFIFYQSAMVLSLLASLLVIVLTWRRRRAPGAGEMIALAAATLVWTLGFYIEANSSTLEQKLFFNNIGYIGSMSVPVAWFIFSLHYTTDNRLVTGWRILPLCIIPLVTVALAWSNNQHHLMWYDEHLAVSGPFTVTAKTYGIFFWIAFAHNYILILTGAVILVRRLFVRIRLFTGQAISLIVTVSLPLIWNIIYVFNLVPLPRKDLTPVMFALSGIAITLGVMRFQLFTAVPFARKFLIQQMSDGILVCDMRHRLLEANPAALNMLGAGKDIIGKSIEYLSPLSPVLERLSRTDFSSAELPLTVSGEERICELEKVPMRDGRDRQTGWITIMRDITERKKMQEQIVAHELLASIGELASGVAHELNSPLSSVVGFSDFLLKRDLPADIEADLNIIISEAERAARIVNNLLTFGRNQPEEKLPADIHKIIEKTLELRVYEQKTNGIRTITRFTPGLPEIAGNEFQLRQVFLNIILNAEFSMKEAHGKGTLTISTERAGGSIRVTFSDDGPGVPEENITRIFNPFFTTKEVGKGTGLGLSICYGIITEHGGKIRAENRPGGGASFIVELPVYRRPV